MHREKFVQNTLAAASCATSTGQAFVNGLCKRIKERFCRAPAAAAADPTASAAVDAEPAGAVVGLVREIAFDETPTGLRLPCEEGGRQTKNGLVVVKVLQSDASLTVVLQGPTEPKFRSMTVKVPTWLQAMSNSTADVTRECYRAVWKGTAGIEALAKAVKCEAFVTTTDRGAPNLRAEAAERRDAIAGQCRLQLPCDVHKCATVCTSVFNLTPVDISGLIGLGLAQKPAGMIQLLRDCITVLLQTRLRIIRRPPDLKDEASAHRTALLSLFLGKDVDAPRRCIVGGFLNGNWKHRRIDHLCGPLCCNGNRYEDTVAQLPEVANAILPHALRLFPRHRWTLQRPKDQRGNLDSSTGLAVGFKF